MAGWLAVSNPSNGRLVGYVIELCDTESLKALTHPIRLKIMSLISAEPRYSMDLARELGIDEQLLYYHVAKLKEVGLIQESETSRRRGAIAIRYKAIADGAVILFKRREEGQTITLSPLFEHLFQNGKPVVMVLGSPEPHGPFRGRGRDHYLGVSLAYSIGVAYGSTARLAVTLDTDPRLDLTSSNLIVIGGPAANMIAARANDFLPIRFDHEKGFSLFSLCSGKTYSDDNCGVIELVENPFGEGLLLLIAGVHLSGTKAAFSALYKQGVKLAEPNSHDRGAYAHVVEGLDEDGDGEIDNAVILE
ncbi:MAG: helix-turn-helix domain-containing protein [Thermofilaceae archaeon]|nr:helix-turn-helix domain-containing protein [Thermofilaceae archaeon]